MGIPWKSMQIQRRPMENQRGHHRAGRLSGAARACKTKPFSMLTQQPVNILPTALGRWPSSTHLGPVGAHLVWARCHSGAARACKPKQFRLPTILWFTKLAPVYQAVWFTRPCSLSSSVYRAPVRFTKPSSVYQTVRSTKPVYQAVRFTKP